MLWIAVVFSDYLLGSVSIDRSLSKESELSKIQQFVHHVDTQELWTAVILQKNMSLFCCRHVEQRRRRGNNVQQPVHGKPCE